MDSLAHHNAITRTPVQPLRSCSPVRTWEAEAGGFQVWGQVQLYSEFGTSLNYVVRHCWSIYWSYSFINKNSGFRYWERNLIDPRSYGETSGCPCLLSLPGWKGPHIFLSPSLFFPVSLCPNLDQPKTLRWILTRWMSTPPSNPLFRGITLWTISGVSECKQTIPQRPVQKQLRKWTVLWQWEQRAIPAWVGHSDGYMCSSQLSTTGENAWDDQFPRRKLIIWLTTSEGLVHAFSGTLLWACGIQLITAEIYR